MSSEKWSARSSITDAVRGDQGLVLDSQDSNNNKRINVEDISRLQSAAKDYSALLKYKVGDFVQESNLLYICITAITIPEAFTPANWRLLEPAPSIPIYSESSTYAIGDTTHNDGVTERANYRCITAIIAPETFDPAKWLLINDINGFAPGDAARGVEVHSALTDGTNEKHLQESISRLQSAANIYSESLGYTIGDFVLFNGTLYRNTTTFTTGEPFDPAKWTEVSGANKVVNVRATSDFPDALLASFTSVEDNGGGFAQFVFGAAHGYTDKQTILIENSTVPAYDGFHVITVISTTKFFVNGLAVGATGTGDCIRCLANDTQYIIRIPITTPLGYRFVDGTSSIIQSENEVVNRISLAGTGQTLFTANNPTSITLRVSTFVDISAAFPSTTNTFLNITGPGNFTGANLFLIRNTNVNNFNNLGTITGIPFVMRQMGFPLYNNGFIVNDSVLDIITLFAFTFIPSTFITLNNSVSGLPGNILSNILTPITPGVNFLDILFSNADDNTLTILNGSSTSGGNYFKPGTEEVRTISAIRNGTEINDVTNIIDLGGGIVSIITTSTLGLVDGNTVTLDNTNIDGDYVISVVSPTSFDITAVFVAADTGIWSLAAPNALSAIITTVNNTFVSGETVKIEGTLNKLQDGQFDIINAFINIIITIPRPFTVASNVGTVTQVRKITSIRSQNSSSVTSITDAGAGKLLILTPDTTGLVNSDSVIFSGTRKYNGTFVIDSLVANTSFEITATIDGIETKGFWDKSGTALFEINTINHGLTSGMILVDGTAFNDGAHTIDSVSTDKIFVSTTPVPFAQPDFQGEVKTGSLDQTHQTILLNTVSGEINSKSEGNCATSALNTINTVLSSGSFTDLVLDNFAVQSIASEEWRLTDKNTMEWKYIGLEPFKGNIIATLQGNKTGGGSIDYFFASFKNGFKTVDEFETPFKVTTEVKQITVDFPVEVVTDDKIRIRVREPGNTAILISSMQSTIKD